MTNGRIKVAGIVIALVGLVLTAIQVLNPPGPEPNQLSAQHIWSYDPMMCNGGEAAQISMKIGALESDRVWLHYFWITNTGHRAIRASDFSKPISLSVKGKEKIVAVLKGDEDTPALSLKDGKIQIAPLLINPGKTINFLAVTERETPCVNYVESSAEWKWDAEIADTQIKIDDEATTSDRWQGPFEIEVYLTGLNIWIALFAGLAFFFLTVEIVRLKWRNGYRRWTVMSGVFLVSVANGENAASLLQPNMGEIWGPALVVFNAHVFVLLAFFALETFNAVFRRKVDEAKRAKAKRTGTG